jgi:hypothetical protein
MGNDAAAYPVNAPRSLVSGYNGDPNTFNCTANDVSVASTSISQVCDANGQNCVAYDPANPPHCNQGSTITLKLTATLQENASSERQDIGFWINTAGGSGLSGSCNHYNIPAGTAGSTNGDGDQCAGLGVQASATIDLGTITVACNADPTNSKLQLGSCITWKVPGETNVCADDADGNGTAGQSSDFRAGTLPTNKAKCNCSPFDINVLVDQFASIEVKKVCVPTDDQGTFDLNIDGVTKKNDATCAGGAASTTGPVAVTAGTNVNPGADHTVSENDFVTANYTSSYVCTKNGSPYISSTSGTGPFTVHVNSADAVVCTFTNERKAGLVIQKDAVPDDPQDFAFTTSGAGLSDFTLDDDGGADATYTNSKAFSNLVPGGTRTVTEPSVSGWTITNIACTGATNSTVTIGASGGFDAGDNSVSVQLAAGETVTCTFTNTKNGSITIIKDATPNDPQDFRYDATGTGMTPSPFYLDDDADPTLSTTQTFSGLLPNGARTVTETVPAGWKVTNITCTGATNSTVVIGAAGGFNAGDHAVTITLAAGENVSCTFANLKLASLTLNKVENGRLPLSQAWTFELRTGATTTTAGTVVATASANITTGVVTFSGYFTPGNYQLCETGIPVGYSNNLNGFTPGPLPGDNSVECVNITLVSGANGPGGITNVPNPINNTQPTGEARTIGYWKNWSSCALSSGKQYTKALARNLWSKTLDGNLPQTIGLLTLAGASGPNLPAAGCLSAVKILNKTDLSGVKRASDPLFNMAAQLLAAQLNITAGADPKCIQSIIDLANALLVKYSWNGTYPYSPTITSADAALANYYAGLLDKYNNNTLVCPIP